MILDKFAPLKDSYNQLKSVGVDPFNLKFDHILSPTEGVMAGRKTILLGTNNYLGLTFDEACVDAAMEALRSKAPAPRARGSPTAATTCTRSSKPRWPISTAARAALVFTTGYQANLGMLSTLVGRGDHLIIDGDSHASIYDGSRLGHACVIRSLAPKLVKLKIKVHQRHNPHIRNNSYTIIIGVGLYTSYVQ